MEVQNMKCDTSICPPAHPHAGLILRLLHCLFFSPCCFKFIFLFLANFRTTSQHRKILQRKLPEGLKLSIAKKIENSLFSKVGSQIPVYIYACFSKGERVNM